MIVGATADAAPQAQATLATAISSSPILASGPTPPDKCPEGVVRLCDESLYKDGAVLITDLGGPCALILALASLSRQEAVLT